MNTSELLDLLQESTIKENIQLKLGQNGVKLGTASQVQINDELLTEQEKFEHLISTYDGDDPLKPYYDYVLWIEQISPKHGLESKLLQILENTLFTFKDDERYKQDFRYADILIKYINTQRDPIDIYELVYNKGLCTMCALFYKAWADKLYIINDLKKADEVYELGIKAKAQPLKLLLKAQLRFQLNIARQVLGRQEEVSVIATEYNRQALCTKLQKQNTYIARGSVGAPGQVKLQVLGNNNVQSYQEYDNCYSKNSYSKNHGQVLTKRSSVNKENTLKSCPSLQNQGNRHVYNQMPTTSTPNFLGYEDEGADIGSSWYINPSVLRPLQTLKIDTFTCPLFVADEQSENLRPMYCKHKVYAGGWEFQFEELRAAAYNRRFEQLAELKIKKTINISAEDDPESMKLEIKVAEENHAVFDCTSVSLDANDVIQGICNSSSSAPPAFGNNARSSKGYPSLPVGLDESEVLKVPNVPLTPCKPDDDNNPMLASQSAKNIPNFSIYYYDEELPAKSSQPLQLYTDDVLLGQAQATTSNGINSDNSQPERQNGNAHLTTQLISSIRQFTTPPLNNDIFSLPGGETTTLRLLAKMLSKKTGNSKSCNPSDLAQTFPPVVSNAPTPMTETNQKSLGVAALPNPVFHDKVFDCESAPLKVNDAVQEMCKSPSAPPALENNGRDSETYISLPVDLDESVVFKVPTVPSTLCKPNNNDPILAPQSVKNKPTFSVYSDEELLNKSSQPFQVYTDDMMLDRAQAQTSNRIDSNNIQPERQNENNHLSAKLNPIMQLTNPSFYEDIFFLPGGETTTLRVLTKRLNKKVGISKSCNLSDLAQPLPPVVSSAPTPTTETNGKSLRVGSFLHTVFHDEDRYEDMTCNTKLFNCALPSSTPFNGHFNVSSGHSVNPSTNGSYISEDFKKCSTKKDLSIILEASKEKYNSLSGSSGSKTQGSMCTGAYISVQPTQAGSNIC